MSTVLAIAVVLVVGVSLAAWAKQWSRRTAAKLIPGCWCDMGDCPTLAEIDHVHGAWCHPSADGCPDRPGM